MASRLSYIQTDMALTEANDFARKILGSESSSNHSQPVTTFYHNHYHWGSGWGWGGYPQPVYCGLSGPSSQKKDHSWVAIPSAVIALTTMYFIGQNHAAWSQAKESMSKLHQTAKKVRLELTKTNAHPALKSTVQTVFEKQMTILDRVRCDAAKGLLLQATLVISVIVTGIGALASGRIFFTASLEPLLKYGCISSLLTTAGMLYRAGFSSKDTAIREEARSLEGAVNQAAGVLQEIIIDR